MARRKPKRSVKWANFGTALECLVLDDVLGGVGRLRTAERPRNHDFQEGVLAMYDVVRSLFPSFSKQFEGRVSWMYLDVKGLVTIGVGNLIDPLSAAIELPFIHRADGSPATRDEIGAEWTALKNNTKLAHEGYLACKQVTSLGLTDDAIDDLVRRRLEQNEGFLKKTFADWDTWPADAQLGVLSMAWAMGAGFPAQYPSFSAGCKKGDWNVAAAQCHIRDDDNPGVRPRNDANVTLFNNAASVVAGGLDPSNLVYQLRG
jgi:GH24 family phage-related lysozyme (muramidase)